MRGMATAIEALEELPHAVAAERDLGADRLALAELEAGDRLAGLGDDRLLAGDQREVGDGALEQRRLLGGPADAHVDDDLGERRDLHHVGQLELLLAALALISSMYFCLSAALRSGAGSRCVWCHVTHQTSSVLPPPTRATRTFLPSSLDLVADAHRLALVDERHVGGVDRHVACR